MQESDDEEKARDGKRYEFGTARSLMRSFYGPMLRDERCAMAPGDAQPLSHEA